MDRLSEYPRSEASVVTADSPFPLMEAEMEAANLDRALDILAAVLREIGKYAVDQSEIEARQITADYDAWAQHVLYATPPPETPQAGKPGSGRRDWAGLQSFVSVHRQREHHYFTRTLSGIRVLIPQALEGIQNALSNTAATDSQIRTQMETLKQAAREGSLEALRHEAFSVAAAVGEVIETRQQQHTRQIEALQAQVRDLNQELKQTRAESTLDALTGLDNRKAFDTHLALTLELRQRFQSSACLLLVDADHFKAINDTYGHAVGDAVLKALAKSLSRTFVSHEDCVARYGGEEFAVILRRVTLEDTRRLTERLMETIRALQVAVGEETVRCTISVGIAALLPGEDGTCWLARADDALYRAKQAGRNRFLIA